MQLRAHLESLEQGHQFSIRRHGGFQHGCGEIFILRTEAVEKREDPHLITHWPAKCNKVVAHYLEILKVFHQGC